MANIKIHFEGGDEAAFDIFATAYPHEAFDAYHDRFCDWMRENGHNLSNDEIKGLVESTRNEEHKMNLN